MPRIPISVSGEDVKDKFSSACMGNQKTPRLATIETEMTNRVHLAAHVSDACRITLDYTTSPSIVHALMVLYAIEHTSTARNSIAAHLSIRFDSIRASHKVLLS